MDWNLPEAKDRLSEVLNLAATEGPQTIRRAGQDFILLAKSEYDRLSDSRPSFKAWLLDGPSFDGLDVDRDRSPMREADL